MSLPRSRIGTPQFSVTPQGLRARFPVGLYNCVSQRFLVIPSRGELPAPTQTTKPSSFRWKDAPVNPQSALNGAGSSAHPVMNR